MKNNKKHSWEKKYNKLDELGKGGNGKVLLVEDIDSHKKYALKYLHSVTVEKKIRFESEIEVLTTVFKGIAGIVPVVDFSKNEHWYVMDLAIPIQKYIEENELDLTDIVNGFIQLCETLEKLHSQNISHRDIKPDNILFHSNRFCFGDFGLVSAPEVIYSITENGRDLGAHFTIAPEMKRYPKEADGCKADIYSLSKTLWMLIAKDNMGFDGQYNFFSENHKLRKYQLAQDHHIALLEELIFKSTDENPDSRPSATDFKKELSRWIKEEKNYFLAEETEWNFLEKRIFPNGIIPKSTKWTDIDDIIKIFSLFAFVNSTDHMFFPDGGGLNLQKVVKAHEKNCIYLVDECNYHSVVSPKCLWYEKFPDKKWNYFLLELNELTPVFPQKLCSKDYCEILCEDTDAHYVCADDFMYGVYSYDSGEPLPNTAKEIHRYLKGRFLVVFGNGYYNSISGTYDSRHSDAPTSEVFYKYIESLSGKTDCLNILFNNLPKKEQAIENYLNKTETRNPFKEIETEIQHKKNKKLHKKVKKLFKFVLLHYKYFLFTRKYTKESSVNFYISFEKKIVSVSFSNIDKHPKKYFLNNKGKLTKNQSEKLLFHNRESVFKMYKNLTSTKCRICKILGNDDFSYDFFMYVEKPVKLKKLFILDEIKQVMKVADDRKTQWLVVDENGAPLLVDNSEILRTYPIYISECFGARKGYLGKYSTLPTAYQCYKNLLIKYLLMLKNETYEYKYTDFTEQDIIQLIKSND